MTLPVPSAPPGSRPPLPTAYLLDTNILLRLADQDSPQHSLVADAVGKLESSGIRLVVSPQNLIELWNVATRPANKNGFGMTPVQAAGIVRLYLGRFGLLEETSALFPLWQMTAERVGVSGVQVHDTRIVAFMILHGVSHILTLNDSDFTRFANFAGASITAVNPSSI